MTTIKDLAAMLDAATGPSREIDTRLSVLFDLDPPSGDWMEPQATIYHNGYVGYQGIGKPALWDHAYLGLFAPRRSDSIDAVLALVERLLPGWFWEVWGEKVHDTGDDDCFGSCLCHSGNPDDDCRANAPTAPLAVLKVLVAALIEQEKTNGNLRSVL